MRTALLAAHLALLSSALACTGSPSAPPSEPLPEPPATAHTPAAPKAFIPPDDDDIPEGPFGDSVRLGRDLFHHTERLRERYNTNGLDCVNCHLDGGRKEGSAPIWAAWPMYPAYRGKTSKVDTMAERIQGCFEYSMNGDPPELGSPELAALLSYSYWLAQGAPTGEELPGRGFVELNEPPLPPDTTRGQAVYVARCEVCHGSNGEGKMAEGTYAFPPLWGDESYNWGAGMHRINTAASFIKYNMPLGQGETLSDQEAWDVSLFINNQERPQDPRHEGDLAATDARFHDENCLYGDVWIGRVATGEEERTAR